MEKSALIFMVTMVILLDLLNDIQPHTMDYLEIYLF